ncbi:MAG: hypothetical protein OSA99_09035 [Acidimicrobiales bacterium]|nr:hypothetical protein [Acidimicrobiales bacterium]
MHVHHLTSVDGEVLHDLDPDMVPGAIARVHLRDGVTADDGGLLARAATYRAALFEERVPGAAVTVRPRLIDTREETLERVHDEIASLADAERVALAVEPGTVARGAVTALDAWLGGLDGRRVVVRGFDDLGSEVAREVVDRGGHLAGLSTTSGAIASGSGLDLSTVDEARAAHGDLFVTELGLELHLPDELLDLSVDAIVVGGGVGVVDEDLALRVGAKTVVPLSDAPFTEVGLDTLRRRGAVALPDTATTAGPMLEALAPRGLTDAERSARSDRLIHERIDGARRSKVDPLRYVTTLADTFLATWVPAEIRPTEPAVRSAPTIP